MKLYEMEIIHSPLLNSHPELIEQKPHPVGIAGSAVYRFEGTDVYSWYKNMPDARWMPHGELIVLTRKQVDSFKKTAHNKRIKK